MEGRREVRHAILKDLDSGNKLSHTNYDLDQSQFANFLLEMQDDGYVSGIQTTKDGLIGSPRATPLGERYIDEHK